MVLKISPRKVYEKIDDNFYVKEVALTFLGVSSIPALYFGFNDAFIYDSLNFASKVYGTVSAGIVITRILFYYYNELKTFRKVMKLAEEQKKEREEEKEEDN